MDRQQFSNILHLIVLRYNRQSSRLLYNRKIMVFFSSLCHWAQITPRGSRLCSRTPYDAVVFLSSRHPCYSFTVHLRHVHSPEHSLSLHFIFSKPNLIPSDVVHSSCERGDQIETQKRVFIF